MLEEFDTHSKSDLDLITYRYVCKSFATFYELINEQCATFIKVNNTLTIHTCIYMYNIMYMYIQ